MFYKRKVYDSLVKWKQEGSKKAILIEGLRQIGKSTLCEEFVNNNYTNVYKFDFREMKTIGLFLPTTSISIF